MIIKSMDNRIHLMHGECISLMKSIPSKSIDMILCDLPYGILNKNNDHAKCDNLIPFEKLWGEYERISKDNAAIVLFGSGMFSVKLIQSNEKMWRYNLVWKKGDRVTGFLNSKRMPLRNHEDIIVFYKKLPTYNPQMQPVNKDKVNHHRGKLDKQQKNRLYGSYSDVQSVISDKKYPKSVIDIQPEHKDFFHPSQKPVSLCEYLIRTYSHTGDVILDNCMGSGTTGVACVRTLRRFIGMEMDEHYFNIAKHRIYNELHKMG